MSAVLGKPSAITNNLHQLISPALGTVGQWIQSCEYIGEVIYITESNIRLAASLSLPSTTIALQLPRTSFEALNNVQLSKITINASLSKISNTMAIGVNIFDMISLQPITEDSRAVNTQNTLYEMYSYGNTLLSKSNHTISIPISEELVLVNKRPITYTTLAGNSSSYTCKRGPAYNITANCSSVNIPLYCPGDQVIVFNYNCPIPKKVSQCRYYTGYDYSPIDNCYVKSFNKENTTCACNMDWITSYHNRRYRQRRLDSTTLTSSGTGMNIRDDTATSLTELSSASITTVDASSYNFYEELILEAIKHNLIISFAMCSILAILFIGLFHFLFIDLYEKRKENEKKIKDVNRRPIKQLFYSLLPQPEFSDKVWYVRFYKKLLLEHDWLCVLMPYDNNRTYRSVKWVQGCGRAIHILFITTIFARSYFADNGVCNQFVSEISCLHDKSFGLFDNLCAWDSSSYTCSFNPNISVINTVFYIGCVCLLCIPLDIFFEYLIDRITDLAVITFKSKATIDIYSIEKSLKSTHELSSYQSFRTNIIRAARLEKFKERMDSVTPIIEADRLLSELYPTLHLSSSIYDIPVTNPKRKYWILSSIGFVINNFYRNMIEFYHWLFYDSYSHTLYLLKHEDSIQSKIIIAKKVITARSESDKVLEDLNLIDNEFDKEIFILRHFLYGCLSGLKQRLAYRYLLYSYEQSTRQKKDQLLEYYCVGILPLYLFAITFYILYFGVSIGVYGTAIWLVISLTAIAVDLFLLQPMKIWMKYVVVISFIKDIRTWHNLLRNKAKLVLMRTRGSLREKESLIQHLNAACRAARNISTLPSAKLLISLTDYDLPTQDEIQQKYPFVIEAFIILFRIYLSVVTLCPYMVQDMIFESMCISVLFGMIFLLIDYSQNYIYIIVAFVAMVTLVVLREVYESRKRRLNRKLASTTSAISMNGSDIDLNSSVDSITHHSVGDHDLYHVEDENIDSLMKLKSQSYSSKKKSLLSLPILGKSKKQNEIHHMSSPGSEWDRSISDKYNESDSDKYIYGEREEYDSSYDGNYNGNYEDDDGEDYGTVQVVESIELDADTNSYPYDELNISTPNRRKLKPSSRSSYDISRLSSTFNSNSGIVSNEIKFVRPYELGLPKGNKLSLPNQALTHLHRKRSIRCVPVGSNIDLDELKKLALQNYSNKEALALGLDTLLDTDVGSNVGSNLGSTIGSEENYRVQYVQNAGDNEFIEYDNDYDDDSSMVSSLSSSKETERNNGFFKKNRRSSSIYKISPDFPIVSPQNKDFTIRIDTKQQKSLQSKQNKNKLVGSNKNKDEENYEYNLSQATKDMIEEDRIAWERQANYQRKDKRSLATDTKLNKEDLNTVQLMSLAAKNTNKNQSVHLKDVPKNSNLIQDIYVNVKNAIVNWFSPNKIVHDPNMIIINDGEEINENSYKDSSKGSSNSKESLSMRNSPSINRNKILSTRRVSVERIPSQCNMDRKDDNKNESEEPFGMSPDKVTMMGSRKDSSLQLSSSPSPSPNKLNRQSSVMSIMGISMSQIVPDDEIDYDEIYDTRDQLTMTGSNENMKRLTRRFSSMLAVDNNEDYSSSSFDVRRKRENSPSRVPLTWLNDLARSKSPSHDPNMGLDQNRDIDFTTNSPPKKKTKTRMTRTSFYLEKNHGNSTDNTTNALVDFDVSSLVGSQVESDKDDTDDRDGMKSDGLTLRRQASMIATKNRDAASIASTIASSMYGISTHPVPIVPSPTNQSFAININSLPTGSSKMSSGTSTTRFMSFKNNIPFSSNSSNSYSYDQELEQQQQQQHNQSNDDDNDDDSNDIATLLSDESVVTMKRSPSKRLARRYSMQRIDEDSMDRESNRIANNSSNLVTSSDFVRSNSMLSNNTNNNSNHNNSSSIKSALKSSTSSQKELDRYRNVITNTKRRPSKLQTLSDINEQELLDSSESTNKPKKDKSHVGKRSSVRFSVNTIDTNATFNSGMDAIGSEFDSIPMFGREDSTLDLGMLNISYASRRSSLTTTDIMNQHSTAPPFIPLVVPSPSNQSFVIDMPFPSSKSNSSSKISPSMTFSLSRSPSTRSLSRSPSKSSSPSPVSSPIASGMIIVRSPSSYAQLNQTKSKSRRFSVRQFSQKDSNTQSIDSSLSETTRQSKSEVLTEILSETVVLDDKKSKDRDTVNVTTELNNHDNNRDQKDNKDDKEEEDMDYYAKYIRKPTIISVTSTVKEQDSSPTDSFAPSSTNTLSTSNDISMNDVETNTKSSTFIYPNSRKPKNNTSTSIPSEDINNNKESSYYYPNHFKGTNDSGADSRDNFNKFNRRVQVKEKIIIDQEKALLAQSMSFIDNTIPVPISTITSISKNEELNINSTEFVENTEHVQPPSKQSIDRIGSLRVQHIKRSTMIRQSSPSNGEIILSDDSVDSPTSNPNNRHVSMIKQKSILRKSSRLTVVSDNNYDIIPVAEQLIDLEKIEKEAQATITTYLSNSNEAKAEFNYSPTHPQSIAYVNNRKQSLRISPHNLRKSPSAKFSRFKLYADEVDSALMYPDEHIQGPLTAIPLKSPRNSPHKSSYKDDTSIVTATAARVGVESFSPNFGLEESSGKMEEGLLAVHKKYPSSRRSSTVTIVKPTLLETIADSNEETTLVGLDQDNDNNSSHNSSHGTNSLSLSQKLHEANVLNEVEIYKSDDIYEFEESSYKESSVVVAAATANTTESSNSSSTRSKSIFYPTRKASMTSIKELEAHDIEANVIDMIESTTGIRSDSESPSLSRSRSSSGSPNLRRESSKRLPRKLSNYAVDTSEFRQHSSSPSIELQVSSSSSAEIDKDTIIQSSQSPKSSPSKTGSMSIIRNKSSMVSLQPTIQEDEESNIPHTTSISTTLQPVPIVTRTLKPIRTANEGKGSNDDQDNPHGITAARVKYQKPQRRSLAIENMKRADSLRDKLMNLNFGSLVFENNKDDSVNYDDQGEEEDAEVVSSTPLSHYHKSHYRKSPERSQSQPQQNGKTTIKKLHIKAGEYETREEVPIDIAMLEQQAQATISDYLSTTTIPSEHHVVVRHPSIFTSKDSTTVSEITVEQSNPSDQLNTTASNHTANLQMTENSVLEEWNFSKPTNVKYRRGDPIKNFHSSSHKTLIPTSSAPKDMKASASFVLRSTSPEPKTQPPTQSLAISKEINQRELRLHQKPSSSSTQSLDELLELNSPMSNSSLSSFQTQTNALEEDMYKPVSVKYRKGGVGSSGLKSTRSAVNISSFANVPSRLSPHKEESTSTSTTKVIESLPDVETLQASAEDDLSNFLDSILFK